MASSAVVSIIDRTYPKTKDFIPYPIRYTPETLVGVRRQITSKLMLEYKDWVNGIDFTTNCKITRGGKTHSTLREHFMLQFNSQYVFYGDLIGIRDESYHKDTITINDMIQEQNIEIANYNNKVHDAITQINLLVNVNEFVEFDGKKYGIIPTTSRSTHHTENRCGGNMVQTIVRAFSAEELYCRDCSDTIYKHHCRNENLNMIEYCYACDKCNFKIFESVRAPYFKRHYK